MEGVTSTSSWAEVPENQLTEENWAACSESSPNFVEWVSGKIYKELRFFHILQLLKPRQSLRGAKPFRNFYPKVPDRPSCNVVLLLIISGCGRRGRCCCLVLRLQPHGYSSSCSARQMMTSVCSPQARNDRSRTKKATLAGKIAHLLRHCGSAARSSAPYRGTEITFTSFSVLAPRNVFCFVRKSLESECQNS